MGRKKKTDNGPISDNETTPSDESIKAEAENEFMQEQDNAAIVRTDSDPKTEDPLGMNERVSVVTLPYIIRPANNQSAPKTKSKDNREEHIAKNQIDEFGLYREVEYKFKENGRIDWKQMIPKEFIAPNTRNFEARGEDIPENLDECDDKDKLILLDGFKYVAKLRRIKSVKKRLVSPSDNYAACTCEIEFYPNCDDPNGITVTGSADFNSNYVSDFTKEYVASMAANRAFIRAVQFALDIPIYGKDEMSSKSNPKNEENAKNTSVLNTLKNLCNKYDINLDKILKVLQSEDVEIDELNDFKEIPKNMVPILIGRIKSKYEKKN